MKFINNIFTGLKKENNQKTKKLVNDYELEKNYNEYLKNKEEIEKILNNTH